MLKRCEASRGHISRLRSTGLYIKEPANCHGIHETVRSFAYKYARPGALEIYDPFRCVQSVVLVHSMPL